MLHPYRDRALLLVPFNRAFQSTDTSWEEQREIYLERSRKIFKTLSPASVDKSVHKIALPAKYRTFHHLYDVIA